MLVAAKMRTSTLITERLPRRENCWSCKTWSNLACNNGGISPISSSKIVPLLHSSNLPGFAWVAPVKAPPHIQQFAFQQISRYCRAIYFQKCSVSTRRKLMYQPGRDFFACAALTQQENRNIDIRDERRLRADRPHRRTGSDKKHVICQALRLRQDSSPGCFPRH